LGKLVDCFQLAALDPIQDEEKRRHEREQKAQQPDNGHLSPKAS
jgi:hypothetical protein